MSKLLMTSPDQLLLIDDVLFDITGMPITLTGLGGFALAALLINLVIRSPFLTSAEG